MTIDGMKTWIGLAAALAFTITGFACKDSGPSGPCYDSCALGAECGLLDPEETLADCNESCDFIEQLREAPEYEDCGDALDVAFACSASLSCIEAEALADCEDDPTCDGDGVLCYDEVDIAESECSGVFGD